jgi:hypothetical protein
VGTIFHLNQESAMKSLLLTSLFCAINFCQSFGQTDSLAVIHFYSQKPVNGVAKSFEILSGAESLATSAEGLEILHQCMPGNYTFSLKGDGRTVTVNAQMGSEYFIEISPGSSQTLKIKNKDIGEEDLKRLRGQ